MVVGDTDPFAGNVFSSTRTFLRVIGATEIRTYRWPPTLERVLDDTGRLVWFDDRWRKCTVTIRKEEPCAP